MPRKASSRLSDTRKSAAKMGPRRSASLARADAIVDLLDASPHSQRQVIDAMRALIARAVPGAVESIKWNAPSFATAEHFATFHLRAKIGVQLVLHLGARPKRALDMRDLLGSDALLLEWKGPDRALVTIRDASQLAAMRAPLARIVRTWARHVG